MLFNSIDFIFVFLPICLLGYFVIQRYLARAAWFFLSLSSAFFYGYWDTKLLIILCISILLNLSLAVVIRKFTATAQSRKATWVMSGAIVANLGLLVYFKYTNFLIDNYNYLSDSQLLNLDIVLPIGISFYTFTQIAYLVDVRKNLVSDFNLGNYFLFVSFFPQLVAGPILHHKEMMPQFGKTKPNLITAENCAIGITLFTFGLFKKVIIADGLDPFVGQVFDRPAESITALSSVDVWLGSLAYTLQLYFDFSGYSDMAMGLARIFGIVLPANFLSPYKSTSIMEFWRRWHMTLSRFLRDYLYFPLGGNRRGPVRRFLNLFLTMFIGGLWHGAGWNFALWGGAHGILLIVNHAWMYVQKFLFPEINLQGSCVYKSLCCITTFLLVVICWVPFRSTSFEITIVMLQKMIDLGELIPEISGLIFGFEHRALTVGGDTAFLMCFALFVVFVFPNSLELLCNVKPALGMPAGSMKGLAWKPSTFWMLLTAAMFVWSLINMQVQSPFLYFQF